MTEDLFSNSHLESSEFKSGYIALVGLPNSGKSTLLNRIIGQKLVIVSDKPQTTRTNVLGIFNQKNAQLLFVDTPGYHDSNKTINHFFVKEAVSACDDADVIVHLFDALKIKKFGLQDDFAFITKLQDSTKNKIIIPVLSKIDLVKKKDITSLFETVSKKLSFTQKLISVAAALSIGIPELLEAIVQNLPFGQPYYPEETLSDKDTRFICAEIVREKIFRLLHDEIPYSTAVQIITYKEEETIDRISANIYVEKDSQKGIIIGNAGSMIKKLGTEARIDIEKMIEKKVYLELYVKVKKDWTKDEKALKEFGYK